MPLEAAVQGRACQVWNGGLQRVEAVVERQKRVAPECNHDGLFLDRQHRRSGFSRASWQIGMRGALPPLRDRLLVDAIALGERSQARLTMLYRSTDRRSRCGAPMVNLAHSASRRSCEKSAPSNPGIKQLAGASGRAQFPRRRQRDGPAPPLEGLVAAAAQLDRGLAAESAQ